MKFTQDEYDEMHRRFPRPRCDYQRAAQENMRADLMRYQPTDPKPPLSRALVAVVLLGAVIFTLGMWGMRYLWEVGR